MIIINNLQNSGDSVSKMYLGIGKNLRDLRLKKGMTQIELSEGICTPSLISQVESGKTTLSPDKMNAIAEKLGVSASDLILDNEQYLTTKVQIELIRNNIAQQSYEQALKISTRLVQEDKDKLSFEQYVEVQINRAEALMRSEKCQQAIEVLNELEHEMRKTEESERELARVFNKMGTAFFLSSDLLKAHFYYGQAQRMADRVPEDLVSAEIEYNLGNTLFWMNRSDDAMRHFQKAQSIFESVSRFDRLASTLYMMGLVYNGENDMDRAAEFLKQARILYEAQNMLQMSQKAREAYAFLVLSKKDPQQARSELMSCSAEFQQMDDTSQAAFAYAEMAFLALEESKVEEAERFLDLSDTLGFGRAVLNDPRAAFAYRVKSELLLKKSDYENSIKHAQNSFRIFDKLGYVKEAAKSLQVIGKVHECAGDLAQALSISKQVIELLKKEKEPQGVR